MGIQGMQNEKENKCTPTHILNEETKRIKIAIESRKRALGYEENSRLATHKITVNE